MTAPAWPHGARAACAFTFDLDAETLWLARGVTEPVTLSQGTFGVLEALPRILELLRQAEISASFFVPAWVAEHHPEAVPAIVAGGHEVGCHGDVHERVSDLEAAEEEKILVRSLEVLTRQAGRRPIGYRAPAWQLSPRTLSLLVRHGFEYSSNMMDRLRPYLHAPLEGKRLVEIPVSWVLDDAPFFMFTGQRAMQPPGPVLQALAHRAGRHHGDRRGHELHLPSADHRAAVALRLPPRARRSRPPDAQALAGSARPDRRARADGARLMALLRGNLHAHTTFSDGVRSPVALVREYESRGYDFLAITDHEDHENWVEPGYQRALDRLQPRPAPVPRYRAELRPARAARRQGDGRHGDAVGAESPGPLQAQRGRDGRARRGSSRRPAGRWPRWR